jgi:hypothetical protein
MLTRRLEVRIKWVLFVTLVGLLLATTAVGQDVRYNFDKTADFTKYKTYKWVSIKDAQPLSDLVDKQIKSALDAELAKKGLTKVDTGDPSLYIGYQAAVGTEKQFTSYNTGWGYGPGWYGGGWYRGGGMTSSTTYGSTSTIYVGQLAVDMYDPAAKDLVWRGTASKTIDTKAKPDKQEKNLAKAVAKLLKNYPPPLKQ